MVVDAPDNWKLGILLEGCWEIRWRIGNRVKLQGKN